MRKVVFLIVLSLTASFSFAQKNQRIAFIDMEYILENVPEYLEAQNTLNAKIAKWRKNLDKQARHIEVLKTDLANEKAILTKDLIEEKEEEITLKQEELRRLESLYFGPRGDMFLVRKQLVKPVQDQVYNAIQKIVKAKKYDFVFDKSSDLVMLYSNKKYDISELILSSINKTRKVADRNAKKKEKNAAPKELTDKQKNLIETKEAAKDKKTAQLNAKKAAKKKLIEEKRKALLEKKEAKRKLLKEKQEAARKKREEQKKEKNNNN
jgi:Skp family chaperone for outer membrane proteins